MYPSYLSHGQLSQHSAAVVLCGLSIVVRVVITFVVVVVVMLFRAIHHGSVHGTVHHGISSVHGSIHHGIGAIVHGCHGGLVHVQQLSAATIISSILCCFLALSFHCTVHHGVVHHGVVHHGTVHHVVSSVHGIGGCIHCLVHIHQVPTAFLAHCSCEQGRDAQAPKPSLDCHHLVV